MGGGGVCHVIHVTLLANIRFLEILSSQYTTSAKHYGNLPMQ